MISFELDLLGIGNGTEFRSGALLIMDHTDGTWVDVVNGPLVDGNCCHRDNRETRTIVDVSLNKIGK